MRPRPTGEHAIVIGASMAGLAVAKALTAGFDRVTVFDRDSLPEEVAQRNGVPQGRHLHALLPAGAEALDELFPGLLEEMVQDGAPTGDLGEQGQLFLNGHRLAPGSTGRDVIFASRPFIEAHVRRRVRAAPAIRVLPGTAIRRLLATPDRRRVIGVEVVPRDGGEVESVTADLVMDCSGRRSAIPRWLEDLGFDEPPREELRIDLQYATRHYRFPEGPMDGTLGVMVGPLADRPYGGGMLRVEGDRWMVTLAGWGGEQPPLDPEGYEAFAARLPAGALQELLREGQPLDDPVAFRYPATVRHHYERLRDFPAGLLVAGDAVCSFNPIYGQGMTVAALEAVTLRRLLTEGGVPTARTWFRSIAPIVAVPWDLAVGGDLSLDCIKGARTLRTRALNGYITRFHAAAATDSRLSTMFLRVSGLLDPPTRLLGPSTVARVVLGNLRGRRQGRERTTEAPVPLRASPAAGVPAGATRR